MSPVTELAPAVTVEIAGRRWRAGTVGHDLSIALDFDTAQPSFFGARRAHAQPLVAGSFLGEVRRGSSCNCATYTITPHCNGTHTECVGHITQEQASIREIARDSLLAALLVSVRPVAAAETSETSDPVPQAGDMLITRTSLEAAAGSAGLSHFQALVVRTLPNEPAKRHRNYDAGPPPPYFSAEALRWIVSHEIRALVVDLPSIDRADDGGKLTAHRIFWGMPPGATALAAASRPQATVTELAYIDSSIADGPYLLNLQIAPFAADAAPSRPILLPLHSS
jgi:arylformamidase